MSTATLRSLDPVVSRGVGADGTPNAHTSSAPYQVFFRKSETTLINSHTGELRIELDNVGMGMSKAVLMHYPLPDPKLYDSTLGGSHTSVTRRLFCGPDRLNFRIFDGSPDVGMTFEIKAPATIMRRDSLPDPSIGEPFGKDFVLVRELSWENDHTLRPALDRLLQSKGFEKRHGHFYGASTSPATHDGSKIAKYALGELSFDDAFTTVETMQVQQGLSTKKDLATALNHSLNQRGPIEELVEDEEEDEDEADLL